MGGGVTIHPDQLDLTRTFGEWRDKHTNAKSITVTDTPLVTIRFDNPLITCSVSHLMLVSRVEIQRLRCLKTMLCAKNMMEAHHRQHR